jgi:hypothetical protein
MKSGKVIMKFEKSGISDENGVEFCINKGI